MMTNERVKSSQKGKEKEAGTPLGLEIGLDFSLKEGATKKASYLCVGEILSDTQAS